MFYLIDLLQDKNKEVQKVADACLDIIMDTGGQAEGAGRVVKRLRRGMDGKRSNPRLGSRSPQCVALCSCLPDFTH